MAIQALEPASKPSHTSEQGVLHRAAEFSTIGLFVIALGVLATVAQPVIVPIVGAMVIGTVLLPLMKIAEEKARVPRPLTAALITIVILGVLVVIVSFLALPVSYWIGRASELGSIVKAKLASIDRPISALREFMSALQEVSGNKPGTVVAVETSSTSVVQTVLGFVTPAVSQLVLFFGAMLFYLVYHKSIKKGAVLFFGNREERLVAIRIINDIERNIVVYFGTFTVINLALGVVTTIMAFFVGLPNPALWGLLAATFNFIPYVGAAIVTVTLFIVGILSFTTLAQALLAPALYVAITTVEGHVLTPSVLGHRLTMNPFLVFLGIGFFTWLWGPVGAFLAVPILLAAVVVFRHMFPNDAPELPE